MSETLEQDTISDIEISAFTKKERKTVFKIIVYWGDGSEQQIFRRYSDFASFHRALYLQYKDCSNVQLPNLPTFQKLFSPINDDLGYLVPDLDLLCEYCKALVANLDNPFVKSFFNFSSFDGYLRRRTLSRFATQSRTMKRQFEGCIEYLVIADYHSVTFNIQAGEVVTILGMDGEGWKMIAHQVKKNVHYGWIPEAYLIEKEENEPLVEDIQMFLLGLRRLTDENSLDEAINDIYAKNNEDVKNGCSFYKYSLTKKSSLYRIDGGSNELEEGCDIIVIDRDADGWWYVTSPSGEGWMASTVLQPKRGSLKNYEEDFDQKHMPKRDSVDYLRPVPYKVTQSYIANQKDELCLATDTEVQVLYQSMSGWWTVKLAEDEFIGLFPAVYLARSESNQIDNAGRACYKIGFNSSLAQSPPPRRMDLKTASPSHSPQLLIPHYQTYQTQRSPKSPHINPNRTHLHLPVTQISASAPNTPLMPTRFKFSEGNDDDFKGSQTFFNIQRQPVFKSSLGSTGNTDNFTPPRKLSPIPLRFYKKTSSLHGSPKAASVDDIVASADKSPSLPVRQSTVPIRSNMQPVELVEPVIQSVPGPVQPVPGPVQPVPGPVQPVPEPVQPIPEPVQPVPEPVQPVPGPVQPVPELVQPVSEPVSEPVKPGSNDEMEIQSQNENHTENNNTLRVKLNEMKPQRTLGYVKFAGDVVIKESIDIEEQLEQKRAGIRRMCTGGNNSFYKKQKTLNESEDNNDDINDELGLDTELLKGWEEQSSSDNKEIVFHDNYFSAPDDSQETVHHSLNITSNTCRDSIESPSEHPPEVKNSSTLRRLFSFRGRKNVPADVNAVKPSKRERHRSLSPLDHGPMPPPHHTMRRHQSLSPTSFGASFNFPIDNQATIDCTLLLSPEHQISDSFLNKHQNN